MVFERFTELIWNMEPHAKRLRTSQEDADKVRADAASRLLLALGSTLNNPEKSDVTFVCKDGTKVYACRWFLCLRNPYFQGMFSNSMLESKLQEIPMPDFSSTIMLSIFEYLCTGAVHSYPPLSWKVAFQIMVASQFFMVPGLETIVEEFLWKEVSKAEGLSQDLVMEMLSEALDFEAGWEGRDAFLLKLTDELRKDWFREEDYSQKLSENAVDWILSKRRDHGNREKEQPSLEEYRTFRHVVLWEVFPMLPKSDLKAVGKLRAALPIEKDAALLWQRLHSTYHFPLNIDKLTTVAFSVHDPTVVLSSYLGIEIPRESFQRLLKHIDWFQIPAMLLLKVIHPLQVVPANAFFKALALHALHRSVFDPLSHRPLQWKYSCSKTSVACDSTGRLTCQSKDGLRSGSCRALPLFPMPQARGVFKWNFTFSRADTSWVWLGVIHGYDTHPWEESGLAANAISGYTTRLLRIDFTAGVTYMLKKYQDVKLDGDCWDKFPVIPAENSPIQFSLDTSKKTCHVSFGDSFATTLWPNLPEATFHPIIVIIGPKSVILKFESEVPSE